MLSILIVSWNTRDLLRRCLVSIEATRADLALEVIVVDNGSQDGTQQMVREEFQEVQLIETERNLGFTGGNNLGLSQARGEWLMLLNPDTEVRGDTLSTLVTFLQAEQHVGVVGPQLFYGDGQRQSSRRRFPTLPTLYFESTRFQQWLGPLRQRYYMADRPVDQPHAVDWLVGAALLLRREVYEQVGGLDEHFFMYYEETDWQRRIKQAGWSIWYLPDATIIHHEGASSDQVVARRHIHFNQSRLYYTEKWHGKRWAQLLRLWLLLLFVLEWTAEAAKWLVGHKRPLRAQRVSEYKALLNALANDVATPARFPFERNIPVERG